MGKGISKSVGVHDLEPVSLSELIHQHGRVAIETAVHEELRAALGTRPYERSEVRLGYRNGIRERMLTGPTGPVVLTLPRATLFSGAGDAKEWTSRIVPRYQRRMPEVNEAVVATYLAGGNTRRIRGALQPLLKATPLSKSAVSRVVATLKNGLETWRTRVLADLDLIYVYLDGFALRVRSERLHEEFRRRVKTQRSLPSEDAAVVLPFSLVASGQIKLRRIDGWRKIAAVLSQRTAVAA